MCGQWIDRIPRYFGRTMREYRIPLKLAKPQHHLELTVGYNQTMIPYRRQPR